MPCPGNAVYRVDTAFNIQNDGSAGGTARAPEIWAYFDLLARPVLNVQQGFVATQYIAVTKDYDELGRVAHVSEPYITNAPTSDSVGAANGGSIYRTGTQYDALGRVTQLTHPNGAHTTTDYSVA